MLKAAWMAVALIIATVSVWLVHDILLIFFAAAVFAIPLRTASDRAARTFRVSSGAGLTVVLVSLAGAAAAILALWESMIAGQAAQVSTALPAAAERVARGLHEEPWASRIAAWVPDPSVLVTGVGGFVGMLRTVVGSTAAAAVNAAILLFAAICFAAEPRTYLDGALRLVAPRRRHRVDAVLAEAGDTIALWLRARLVSMLTIAILSGTGLWLLGIPDALALGVLSGLFAFIPNVGPVAAAIPSLLLAAPFGWQRVVAVVLLYWVAHALDDFVVIPVAERRVVRLPPALTIAAQMVLGLSTGILGIMMAAPLVAVTIVLVHRLLVEDFIERDGTNAGEPAQSPVHRRAEGRPRH